jgi:hypothetical protein
MGILRSSNAAPFMSHKGHSRRFDSGLDRDLPNGFAPNVPVSSSFNHIADPASAVVSIAEKEQNTLACYATSRRRFR